MVGLAECAEEYGDCAAYRTSVGHDDHRKAGLNEELEKHEAEGVRDTLEGEVV